MSTGPGSMALDLQPSATGPVSLELGHSNVEFEFESMSPRWAGRKMSRNIFMTGYT